MTQPNAEDVHDLLGEIVALQTLLWDSGRTSDMTEAIAQARRTYATSPNNAAVGLAALGANRHWRLAETVGCGPEFGKTLKFPRGPILEEVPPNVDVEQLVKAVDLIEAQVTGQGAREAAFPVIELGFDGFCALFVPVHFLGEMVVDTDPTLADLGTLIAREALEHERGFLDRGRSYE